MAAHIGPRQRCMAGVEQRVPLGTVQQHGFAKQFLIRQAVAAPVLGDDAQLVMPGHDPLLDSLDGAHMQVDDHIRGLPPEQGHGLCNVGLRVAGGFVEHGHMQAATQAVVQGIHAGPEALGGGHQLPGFGVYALAFGREGKAAATATAQGQAQAGFQVFDMAADGGGADVEFQLGGSHAAAVHNGLKNAQQADVGIADLAEHGPFLLLCGHGGCSVADLYN